MRILVAVLATLFVAVVGCGGGDASGSGGGGGGGGGSGTDGALVNSQGDARAEGCLAPSDAAGFQGQLVLVCGTVVDSVYMPDLKRTTFIYFDAAPPGQSLTAQITGDMRSGFNPFPEDQFAPGTNVCIEGIIQKDGDGKPLIDVQSALNMLVIDTLEIHGEHCAGN